MPLRKMLSFNVSFMDLFPAPPTHTLRRNSSLETIVPGRHNNLRAAPPARDILDRSVTLPPAAPAPTEQFLSEEELQELWSEVGHWTALRVIQPGGLNHKYVYSTSRGTLSLTHHRLATLLFSLYRTPHPLLGHACGYNTPSVRRTERPFVVIAGVDILQFTEYSSWDEAAARLLAFAPPVTFYGCASARKPAWTLHLGPRTLKNYVYIGDTFYVDHSGYYAGGVVSDVFLEPWARDPVNYRRCLVEGAWMNDQAGGGNGNEFYLLVHQDCCLRKARPVYPMRWIVSDLDHSTIDPDFQDGAFPCLRSAKYHDLIVAQNGCQPTSELDRSHHCRAPDETIIQVSVVLPSCSHVSYPSSHSHAARETVRSNLIILAFKRDFTKLRRLFSMAGTLTGPDIIVLWSTEGPGMSGSVSSARTRQAVLGSDRNCQELSETSGTRRTPQEASRKLSPGHYKARLFMLVQRINNHGPMTCQTLWQASFLLGKDSSVRELAVME
jgi:hypothetical protein